MPRVKLNIRRGHLQRRFALHHRQYSGDSSYNASSASAVTFSVAQATPNVLIVTPESSYPQGTSSSLTVLVEGMGNGAAPTGTVAVSGAPKGTATSAALSAG